ncbi:hypothetical protein QBC38DRAFT_368820 [Podospora fimiseda]|uniref:Uncharacterized protein n=1 Tax=Podospora fimiseda TaxID=252190 RepID=A0AAN7GRP3_9PEZI|nr:hypothetical protein QBC38DRAFT_368820 [Podospora fimiseda]
MCDLSPESPTPFCGPAEGTQVRTGETIDVTWSSRFFATSPTSLPRRIRIQADYFFPNNNTRTGNGFTSLVMSPSSGRFTWRPLERDLPTGINTLTAAIFIAEPFTDSDGNGTTLEGNDRFAGPRVRLIRGSRRNNGQGGPGSGTGGAIVNNNNPNNNMGAIGAGGPNPLAIVLPVVFGVVTLVIMAGFMMWKKRNPGWSMKEAVIKGVPALLRRRIRPKGALIAPAPTGTSYTGPRIRGQDIKVVTTDINGLRMNAMRLAGGGVGEGETNVFREEMMRQERLRF